MDGRVKRGLHALGVLLAAAAIAAVSGSVARAGSTLQVCVSGCTYSTIQAAVNAANAGDTIQVSAGTYAENVTVGKSLTLEGVQSGPTKLSSITITSSDVTVDGFTFTSTSSAQVSVNSSSTLSGIVIQNDVFAGYVDEGLATYDAGDILVQHNSFSSPTGSGEGMQIKASTVAGGCNGTQVLDNTFSSATNNGGADVNLSCTGSASSNVTVSGNTTSGDSGGSSFTAFSGVTGGIEVRGNSGSTDGSAIFVFGSVSGSATIEDNTFSGSGGSGVSIHGGDIDADGANSGAFTITNNDLAGEVHGISVASGSLTGSLAAHGNDLSAGLVNNSAATVDASGNWWGGQAGPGTLAGATTAPWCTESGCTFTSDSADLGSLALSAGTLSPVFSASTTSYTTSVPNGTASVSVSATAGPGAVVAGSGASSLAVGANTIRVTVRSLDGAHTKTYSVVVTRAAATAGGTTAAASPAPTTTVAPTTTSQPAQAATVVNQSQSASASATTAGTVAVVVAPVSTANAAPAVPVSVTLSWAPGVFTEPVTVQVTPKPEVSSASGAPEPLKPVAGGFSVGSTVVQVNVTTDGGAPVTQFAAPLVLHVSSLSPGQVPAYSHDGSSWTTIPRLSSPDLPSRQADGYFVNADGSVDIYTRHATLFGLLLDTKAPSRPIVTAHVTGMKLRLTIHAKDNVAVAGYQVRLNGKVVKQTTHAYLVLAGRAAAYQVTAMDAAGNKSKPTGFRVARSDGKLRLRR